MRACRDRHLGAQQHELLLRTLHEQREAAMRGGVPGTEFDAAAKLTVDGMSAAEGFGAAGASSSDVVVTLEGAGEGGKTIPLWPTVYWCLRCGDLPAAVRTGGADAAAAARTARA